MHKGKGRSLSVMTDEQLNKAIGKMKSVKEVLGYLDTLKDSETSHIRGIKDQLIKKITTIMVNSKRERKKAEKPLNSAVESLKGKDKEEVKQIRDSYFGAPEIERQRDSSSGLSDTESAASTSESELSESSSPTVSAEVQGNLEKLQHYKDELEYEIQSLHQPLLAEARETHRQHNSKNTEEELETMKGFLKQAADEVKMINSLIKDPTTHSAYIEEYLHTKDFIANRVADLSDTEARLWSNELKPEIANPAMENFREDIMREQAKVKPMVARFHQENKPMVQPKSPPDWTAAERPAEKPDQEVDTARTFTMGSRGKPNSD